MEVCVMIEGQEGVTWDQWLALADASERLGYRGLFRSDHYLSFSDPARLGTLDAWTTLAALAGKTERIRLGALVSPATFRHPSVLAKAVATVDHISGGRVELGLGAGWFDREHAAFGIPFPPVADRMRLLEEQVEIVCRLWDRNESEVSFEGVHYRLDSVVSMPKPAQEPRPPLILGGAAKARSAALAARWADEYNFVYVDTATADERGNRIAAACEEAGRDPGEVMLSLMSTVLAGKSQAELKTRAARVMKWDGEPGDPAAYLEALGPYRIFGTPGQILGRLAAYAEVGIERVYLQHLLHDDLEMLELIATEVLPETSAL